MAGRFSVEAVFRAVDRMSAPVSKMQNRVGKATRAMERGFRRVNRSVSGINQGLRKAAFAATAALALTGGAMADVINTGAQFEQSIVNAAAKFPGEIRKGTEAFKELELAARQVGKTTEFTAKQSAGALDFLAMAGFNAEQSVAALPGVVDLATAANLDLAQATDIASDSLGSFGLMTKDSAQLTKNLSRVNDVLAKTVTTANTDMEALFETIKDGGPVATAAGASIETFAALAGELANSGIKGSKAGTTLKNMFLKLAAPAGGAAKLLKKLGVETKDAEGNMLDITDILGQLGKGLDGVGTADRSAAIDLIFGKRAIAGVNVLLQSGSKRLKEYRGQLEGATGASKSMAAAMRDTVVGQLNSLKSAVEGVKISIFSLNKGPLSDAIKRMTEWVRANEAMIAQNIGEFFASVLNNIDGIVLGIRRVAGVLIIWGAFTMAVKAGHIALVAYNLATSIFANRTKIALKALKAYQFVVTLLPRALVLAKAAMWALNVALNANPIGLIVAGIAALIAVAALVIIAWEPVKNFFVGLWEGILNGFKKVMGFARKFSSFFGFGSQDEAEAGEPGGKTAGGEGPQVVTPQERLSRKIEEKRETSTAEVTIRDETGKAAVTAGRLGVGLQLQQSGAF